MNPLHEEFADWDAAYVIGALSPSDRRAYEEHLVDCAECGRAVGELAPTVGLLSRITTERAMAIAADQESDVLEGTDPATRAAIVSLAARRARKRRRTVWTLAAAAVVIVIAAIAVPLTISRSAAPAFALESVADAPLEASVQLDSVAWGTRIDLECRYTTRGGSDAPADGWPYSLDVVGADGVTTTVSTWRALPGSTARLSAGTALDAEQISAIEIRSIGSGRLLMRYEFDPFGSSG